MITASYLFVAGISAISLASADHGDDFAKTMGPVAFLWPPDREWGAAQDNTAPCGSAQGVANRTEFPLLHGQVALVAQDESWSVQVAISHKSNPISNDDFETIIDGRRIPEFDEGHECYPVPNPSADVESGANATLQIKYFSEFDTDNNETFYACADITYVASSQFTYQVPCFNATVDDFNVTESSASATAAGASATSSPTQDASSASSSSSSSGLSGGAIAGIVVGVVVGVVALLGLMLMAYRRSQQRKRQRAHEASLRTVKWDQDAPQSAGQDINLHKLR